MPTIDIPDNDPRRQQVNASGGQTVFNYNFILFDEADLVVIQEGNVLTLGVDYTVTGVGNESGGTFVLASGATAGDLVTYYGATAVGRASQYQVDGRFDAPPLERDLDRITVILQEQSRDIERTVKLNVEDPLGTLELPTAVANKAIKWNATADALVNSAFDPDEQATLAAAAASAASGSASSASASASTATTQAGLANTARIAAELAETNAAASAAAAQVAKIEWQGNWSAGTYQVNDAVAHNGSSWIATAVTTEEPSISATDWDLLALKGVDGVGLTDGDKGDITVSSGGTVWSLNDSSTARTNLGLGALAEEDDAAGVPYDNTLSGLTATDVQAAIDELAGAPSGGVIDQQVITASGDWNKPSSGTIAFIEVWGGGGGGASGTGAGCGGGGGGAYKSGWIQLSELSTPIGVTVGAGGAGGTGSSATNGGQGGDSSFGSLLTAYGGAGGRTVGNGGGGGGGSASAGSTTTGGGISGGTAASPGGSSLFGGGGGGLPTGSNAGSAGGGSIYGGGGGGAGNVSTGFGGNGGASVYGGAGGAGSSTNDGAAGLSDFGGDGGAVGSGVGNSGGNGGVRGGGGGSGKSNASGGNGGRGEVRVTVF
jgi:hypothetical protein